MVSQFLRLHGAGRWFRGNCGGISLISPESGGGYIGQGDWNFDTLRPRDDSGQGTCLLPPRRTPVATASLLVATTLSVFMLSAPTAQAQGRSGACEESNLAVLASPVAPWKGAPL